MKLRGRAAGLLLSALLYPLAFPPVGLQALAWFALAPLFVVARRSSVWGAALLGVLWLQIAYFILLDALPTGVTEYFASSALVGWSFTAVIFLVNAGVYYGAALAAYRALAPRSAAAAPLLAAAAWCAAELGRARLLNGSLFFLGTPLGAVSDSQVGWDTLIQVAAVTGPYGISFVVVAWNAALAELWISWRDQRPLRGALAGAGLAGAAVLAVLAFGLAELRAADAPSEDSDSFKIAIVQGHTDPGLRWEAENFGRNLDEYLDLTQRAFRLDEPRVVFWPEAAMTFHLRDEAPFRELIGRVLASGNAELVAGGPRATPGEPPSYYNSVFLLSPAGEIEGHYDKEFLLPFAEFAPITRVDFLQRRFGPYRFWRPGLPTAPLATRAGLAGVLVCNEAWLPQLAAERVTEGAEYLVSPSNDGWVGGGWTPWPNWGRLMVDVSALRAVEQRRYMVRASTSGPSAIIDPWGRVRARTEPGVAAILIGSIRPRSDRSPYGRVGDLFAGLCLVTVLGALSWRRLFRRGTDSVD